MKKSLITLFLLLSYSFAGVVHNTEAVKGYVFVINNIDDKDDPICLKAVNFTTGKVEDISHKIDEPIGKEFKVKINTPQITNVSYEEYLKNLDFEEKHVDSIELGNKTKKMKFSICMFNHLIFQVLLKEGLSTQALPAWKPGFVISPISSFLSE